MIRRFKPLVLASCLSATLLLPACKGKENAQNQEVQSSQTETTVTTAQLVSEGLDLSMIPEMVKEAKDAEELEGFLNESGVNNLDLNNDKKIDYLNVEEYREGQDRGFALFTNEDGQRIDVARVAVNTQAQNANVVVQGNPNYYGQEARYQSSFPVGQVLMAAWLFNMTRPRYYHTPYYYGRYPTSYRTSFVKPRSVYQSRVNSGSFSTKGRSFGASSNRTPASTTFKRTTTNKAGAKSTGSSANRSLSNTSGKSFSTTTNKRPAGSSSTSTSGFGSGSSRSNTSLPPQTSTGSSSNRSSGFGSSSSRNSTSSSGSRSSGFGSSSSRRSTSSSSRSSSSRRRR